MKLDEVHKECERLQDELGKERDHCRRLVDAEKRDVLAAKDKMQVQIAQLKAAHEEVPKCCYMVIFLYL